VPVAPPMVAFFHFLQFLALLVSEVDSYLPVRFHPNLANAAARVVPHLRQIPSRFIDDRRNFRVLFGRQTELRTKLLLHSSAYVSWMVKLKEHMPGVRSRKGNAGNYTSDKYKKKSSNKFPLQCWVHCENSS
jgi:hypothetical protein